MHPTLPMLLLEDVSSDPSRLQAALEGLGPFRPVQRYFQSEAEMRTVESTARGECSTAPQVIRPWFRVDVADPAPLPTALRELWHDARLALAGKAVLGREDIEPIALYVNVVLPARGVDAGHYDIPRFVGLDRTNCPVWLLTVMLASKLFDAFHRPTATAVIWFYRGPGGAFEHWPAGRSQPPMRIEVRDNTALVSDNDRVFHRICSVAPAAPVELWELSAGARLELSRERWLLRDGTRAASGPRGQARVSLALKFAAPCDGAEALDLAHVRRVLQADLEQRGEPFRLPDDFETDPESVALLARIHARE